MKILQINAVYAVGSTGTIIENIHDLCLSKGIESYVAYSLIDKADQQVVNGYKIGHMLGKKAHALFCRFGGKQAYFSSFSTRKFLRYIEKIKPDIVHLHNLHSNYINLNMLLSFLAKNDIATVITMHDCWYFTGGCFHYRQANCYKWLENCGDCPKRMEDTKAYFRDCSGKILSDRKKYLSKIKHLTIVGVSDWITGEAKKSFLKDANIVTIHNGVDVDFFNNTHSDFKTNNNLENKFLILGLASKWLDPANKETLEYFIKNMDADEELILLNQKNKNNSNNYPNVRFLDFIKDQDELRKIYSACDVFANCTRNDTFPFVNLESQACGTPVITYKNTGAEETVNNICAFAVEDGNFEEFYSTIKKIKCDGKDEFSRGCREWIINNFNEKINYQKYIDLYKEILKQNRK